MKKAKNKFRFSSNKRPIEIAIVLWTAFTWSWIFSSSIAELSNSLLAGYLLAALAFSVIVLITSVVFIYAFRSLYRQYQSQDEISWLFVVKLFFIVSSVEFLAMFLSTVVWAGRGGSLDTLLPFTSFTPLIAYTPLIFASRLLGFFGVSALVITLLAVVLSPKLRKFFPVVLGLVVLLNLTAWAIYRVPSGADIKVLVAAEKLEKRLRPIQTDADLVVMPEYAYENDIPQESRLSAKNNDTPVYYVGSKLVNAEGVSHNILVFGSTDDWEIEAREKSRLIPGGEYLPLAGEIPLRLSNSTETLDYFFKTKSIEKGPVNNWPIYITDQLKLGSAVCASIISTEDYRKFALNGSTIFTNSASLGIFNSSLFTLQHEGLARFMAVSNARPFAQSSNSGNAFIINHDNQVLTKASPVEYSESIVTTNSKLTPYTLVGEWTVVVGFVTMFIGYIGSRRKAKSKQNLANNKKD